jgi:hypothetical protein
MVDKGATMFSDVYVKEPVEKLLGDWDLLGDVMIKKFSRFKRVGDNIIGIRRRMCDGGKVLDAVKGELPPSIELGPNGIVTLDNSVLSLRMTCGGTPHRVPHSFGFWHINDMDELYLTLPGSTPEVPSYCLVIMQHPDPTGHAGESVAEYCEQCLTIIFERHFRTAELGFEGVFRFYDESMREYNQEPENRLCPECGHLNPCGYTWNPERDTPEMALAREQW